MRNPRTANQGRPVKIGRRFLLLFSTGVACLCISRPASATVTLGGLFSDHMVAQRAMEVPVWGTDTANQSITVKLGTQQATGTAGADGKWTVRLPAQDAGGPFSMTVTGSSTATVADVYVGEVWLGSGQSNMGYTMQCGYAGCAMKDAATEIAAANYPLIRTTNFSGRASATPVSNTSAAKSTWLVVSPQTAPGISAIGYFFSRELFKNLNGVAIGLIHSSSGGSCLQCWMSKEAIQAIPSVTTLLAQFEANPSYSNVHNPYICYNGQIAPLIPYAIHGVVWYQGESVTWGGDTYRDIQVGLISSWRKAWGQDFTFLITQLPNYSISSSGWPVLREAQLQASQILPNTGISVNIDIGDPNYVHPSDKPDQGLRLGMAARGLTYGQTDFAYYSPIYDHMAIEGSSIRLYFTHAETGLAFKGGTGTGFEIAGADNNYVTATAVIQPDATILVSAASVTAPKNARYCWAGNPTASLFNQGTPALPASPFRTDPPALPAGTPTPDAGVVGRTDAAVVGPKDAAVVPGDAAAVVPKDSGPVGGAGGSGGSGAGGNTGAGGKSSAGGTPGSGGALGGNLASGGNLTSGGNLASGGNLTSGGTLASGGNPTLGGNPASGGTLASGGSTQRTSATQALPTGGTTAAPEAGSSGCSCKLANRSGGLSDTAIPFLLGLLVWGRARARRASRRSPARKIGTTP